MMNIDDEWSNFLKGSDTDVTSKIELSNYDDGSTDMPKCDELYISTKTKVLFLNKCMDIHSIFWNIPITEYWRPNPGVVKKQMKIVSNTPEEYNLYVEKLANIPYYTEHVIRQINNPNARRNKFKDERKITIGMSKKDIMNCRGKVKNAFYNCFAMILRFIHSGVFHEIHVKIFNTGKMEIPGVLNANLLNTVKRMILETINPLLPEGENEYHFIDNAKEDSVLINSNFNCGFYINREKLYSILRSPKYNIETAYDPCSYPGVKCKFYFNHEYGFDTSLQKGDICKEDRQQKMSELGINKKYTDVSFMIFRTGSCLIVGNCTEEILQYIFTFVKTILQNEYDAIQTYSDEQIIKEKKHKIRKKIVTMSSSYYDHNIVQSNIHR